MEDYSMEYFPEDFDLDDYDEYYPECDDYDEYVEVICDE
jgi:hypothetical protein